MDHEVMTFKATDVKTFPGIKKDERRIVEMDCIIDLVFSDELNMFTLKYLYSGKCKRSSDDPHTAYLHEVHSLSRPITAYARTSQLLGTHSEIQPTTIEKFFNEAWDATFDGINNGSYRSRELVEDFKYPLIATFLHARFYDRDYHNYYPMTFDGVCKYFLSLDKAVYGRIANAIMRSKQDVVHYAI